MAAAFVFTPISTAVTAVLRCGSRDPRELIGVLLLGGAVGAVVELLSSRLQDNVTLPVFTAWALQLAGFGWV